MANGYAFVEGHGKHYGIPARDLTQEEFDALDPLDQRTVRESPVYRELADTDAKKQKADAKEGDK